ncbi:hypothetical protein R6Q57_015830 [Mikania cordata]
MVVPPGQRASSQRRLRMGTPPPAEKPPTAPAPRHECSTSSHTILNRLEIYWFNYNKTQTSITFNNIHHFQQHPPNFQPPSNFQPGFAPYSQPRFESDFVSSSQPDNEVVLETQDTQKRKKGKKNKQPAGTGPSSGPMAPKQWTHNEEIALGRCYMDESENKTKGNSQKRENFWKKVTVTWHNVMGFDAEYRTYH